MKTLIIAIITAEVTMGNTLPPTPELCGNTLPPTPEDVITFSAN